MPPTTRCGSTRCSATSAPRWGDERSDDRHFGSGEALTPLGSSARRSAGARVAAVGDLAALPCARRRSSSASARASTTADLDELEALADSAGAEAVARVVQSRHEPDPATYIGRGKLEEVHAEVHRAGADSVILDQELTPGQLRSLEERLGVKVVDRTALILDIFALHARSREGKAQVELAQLNYLLPRLRGWGEAMSRAGGGVGTRFGGGETKMEVDRQHIGRRIAKLRRELKALARTRETKRSRRQGSGIPQAAIAGIHELGQVHADEPADGRRCDRGRPALRDARSHRTPSQAARRPSVHHQRHGGVREQASPRPGGGVPIHPGGGHAGRARRARRRRRRPSS